MFHMRSVFEQRSHTLMLLIAGGSSQVPLLPMLDFNHFLFLLTMAYGSEWDVSIKLAFASVLITPLFIHFKAQDCSHFGVAKKVLDDIT